MKKYSFLSLRWPYLLALCLVLQDFTIPKTFSYAEDGINTFQQEILYAKQKQQTITAKMDAAHLLLDSEKPRTI